MLDRRLSFWLLALLLILLLAAASAPSPLYGVYQAMWHFPAFTLTGIYAIYAVSGIAALATTGRLPDYLGRRTVVVGALVIEIAAMLVFVTATDVNALLVGRLLAGTGVGVGAGAVSAWLLDMSPANHRGLGSLVTGVAVLLGLGSGAMLAGFLVEYGPDRLHLIYWLLAVAYGVFMFAAIAIDDPIARRPGWIASLRPAVGVPSAARSVFTGGLPAIVGMWALAGLYLALGPSLVSQLLRTENHAVGGLVVFALAGTGAAAAVFVRSSDPGRLLVRGPALLIVGVVVTLTAVALSSPVAFYVGTVIAGVGLGSGFSAFVRATTPLVPAEQRGALVASITIAVYLSFSVPTIVAGALATNIGLIQTTYGYGVTVVVLAAMTTFVVSRRLRTQVGQPT